MCKMSRTKWCGLMGVAALLLAMSMLAPARADRAANQRTLTVSGSSEVMVKPDRAVVSFGAQAQGKTAAEATAKVNQLMNSAIAKVRKVGISKDAMQTSSVSLYPIHERRKSGETKMPAIVGYRANNQVRVTVDDLSKIGKILDAANKGGANRANGVQFQLKDDTLARTSALQKAAWKARNKARALAAALKLDLGKIASVNGQNVRVAYPRMMRVNGYAGSSAGSATPISTGQITVSGSVRLVYELK